MKVLAQHEKRSNHVTRKTIVSLLYAAGFEDCGVYSTSGTLRAGLFNNKPALTFGKKCNHGSGKGFPKYFTLVKTFDSKKERDAYAKSIIRLVTAANN